MKKCFAILVLLLCATTGWSQGKVWLPELFVQHAMAGDAAEDHLKPFRFISDPPDSGLVWTYGAPAISRVTVKRVIHNGKEKWQLYYLAQHFYRKAHPREYINRFYTAQVYLSTHGRKLLLEIVEDGNTEQIEFVDRAGGEIFTDGPAAIEKLRQPHN